MEPPEPPELQDQDKGTPKKATIGFGAIASLRKWRVTARDKYGVNNPKSFAKSDMHLRFLTQHTTDVATDVPVPMKVR